MCKSIIVTNASGARRTVALLAVDPSSPEMLSLVWQSKSIDDGANHPFDFDDASFGLGLGSCPAPIAPGIIMRTQQQKTTGPLNVAGAANCAAISYVSGDFAIDTPFAAQGLTGGQLALQSDQSFTVADASAGNFCAALFLHERALLATPLAPNFRYLFSASTLVFYLTVTTAAPGTALQPAQSASPRRGRSLISQSNDTRVDFVQGQDQLAYNLTPTLSFELVTGVATT